MKIETLKELKKELEILESELLYSETELKKHTDLKTIGYINSDIIRKKKEIADWKTIIINFKQRKK